MSIAKRSGRDTAGGALHGRTRLTIPVRRPVMRVTAIAVAAFYVAAVAFTGGRNGCTQIHSWKALRLSGRQKREERDAPQEVGHAAAGKERTRRSCHEPQAGDRDRALGGEEEGREGAA